MNSWSNWQNQVKHSLIDPIESILGQTSPIGSNQSNLVDMVKFGQATVNCVKQIRYVKLVKFDQNLIIPP